MYSEYHVSAIKTGLKKADFPPQMMIDFSHANSSKQPSNQRIVAENVARGQDR